MKLSLMSLRTGILVFIVMACTPCQAVLLVDRGDSVALSNGLVSGEIEKRTGRMLFLNKGRSPNLVGHSWYWSIYAQDEYEAVSRTDYRLVRQTPNLVEVAFKQSNMSNGQLDFDVHYVLTEGVSGFYANWKPLDGRTRGWIIPCTP